MKTTSPYTDAFYSWQAPGSRLSATVVVPEVLKLFRCKSVVDVGCGVGTWARVFQEHGIDTILGLDGSYVNRTRLEIPESCFRAVDLTLPLSLGRRFDLAVCLEVAEHLPGDRAASLVADLTAVAPIILFSAAVPGQGGNSHINEQWPEYWQDLFSAHSYKAVDCLRPILWNDRRVDWWYKQNLFLYVDPKTWADCPGLAPSSPWPFRVVHPEGLTDVVRGRVERRPRPLLRATSTCIYEALKVKATRFFNVRELC
jgi:SAM-dependent methyltransferase